MMYRYCFILLFICNGVLCEDCVTEDFENGFGSNYTNYYGWCNGINMWEIGKYSSLSLNSPHPDSTSFITLQTTWTCMTSFNLTITKGGTLEVTRYMASRYFLDNVNVEVMQFDIRGRDFVVANGSFSPSQADFVRGWQILRIPIPGSGEFPGYFRFWGRASPSSVVLIDSFRYIAPSVDEDSCVIYNDRSTTTADVTTTTTTLTTTELSPSKTTSTELPTTSVTTESSTTATTVTKTTAVMPPTTTAPPTKTPRLSISILLLKIKKFFR